MGSRLTLHLTFQTLLLARTALMPENQPPDFTDWEARPLLRIRYGTDGEELIRLRRTDF